MAPTTYSVQDGAWRPVANRYNGTTTTGTTDDGKIGTTEMGNLLVSLGGTRNADGTITDATGTTYSVQDGAWRPVADTTVTGGTTTPTGGIIFPDIEGIEGNGVVSNSVLDGFGEVVRDTTDTGGTTGGLPFTTKEAFTQQKATK
jgi:hypothetical protein